MADPNGLALGIARRAVRAVRISSNLNPEVRIALSGAAPGSEAEAGGLGDALGRLLRPKIVVETELGDVPVAWWGEPEPLIGVAVTVALAWLALKAITRS